MKKFSLTPVKKGKLQLFRITALIDGPHFKKGQKGGLIQHEHNLSQEGNSWIGDGCQVIGKCEILDSSVVLGKSKLRGKVILKKGAVVTGKCLISGNILISGSTIQDEVNIQSTNLIISGNSKIVGPVTLKKVTGVLKNKSSISSSLISGSKVSIDYGAIGFCSEIIDTSIKIEKSGLYMTGVNCKEIQIIKSSIVKGCVFSGKKIEINDASSFRNVSLMSTELISIQRTQFFSNIDLTGEFSCIGVNFNCYENGRKKKYINSKGLITTKKEFDTALTDRNEFFHSLFSDSLES